MNGTMQLARIAGIDIRIHFTFPLILLWGAWRWGGSHGASGAVYGALLMAGLFACVLLHELGHALVARRLGIQVRQIVLLPIGGVALLQRTPRRPWHELLIAIAGPLVSFALALLFFLAVLRLGLAGDLSALQTALAQGAAGTPSLTGALGWLFVANLGLALFNLVPAFPMDGGRILRSLLAVGLGFRRATRIATRVGQGIALAGGVWAVASGNPMLAFVALFVFLSASGEQATEAARRLLSTLRLSETYNKHALVLQPGDRLSTVVDYLLTSYQPDFAVVHGGGLLGVVTRDGVLRALGEGGEDSYVASFMNRNVLRLPQELSLAQAQERMSEAEARVAAVFDGESYLGLVNLDDLREALQIAALSQRGGRGGDGVGVEEEEEAGR